ncbi:flavin monoamine oxidase family protein [Methylocella sp.]|uniref:flavin monoamine oxidase family protein n=1 Tax=Methylocella sp. TaxID=1978226 RepID=UPI0037845BFA
MLETAIVGGGLCGLRLAAALEAQGRDFAVFEARPRLGGRILSEPSQKAGMRLDLGPTWFWPDTQPKITRLVAELGLKAFPQHDEGDVLRLDEFDKKAQRAAGESVHGGARRLEDGMASLAEALIARVQSQRFRLKAELRAVKDCGDHVELAFIENGAPVTVAAKQVVLALPPRLLEQNVVFGPALDAHLVEAMRETYTWMAAEAKIVTAFDAPLWRETGASGNAFVTHADATLYEIFDACDASGKKAALGAFVALPAELRKAFSVGLPLLAGNQIEQVFGAKVDGGEQHFQDWAEEGFTASARDLVPPGEHPAYDNPHLRQAAWEGRLLFGGSETAASAGGYMEGALDAAERLARDISRFAPQADLTLPNEAALAEFGKWAARRQSQLLAAYRVELNRLLASPDKEIVTQRAMLAAMDGVFAEALRELDRLPLDLSAVRVELGRAELTPRVLKYFDGFFQSLLDGVTRFNRTSCALSNFPGEHKLSKDYVQAILLDLAAAWREFCLMVNDLLVARIEEEAPAASA